MLLLETALLPLNHDVYINQFINTKTKQLQQFYTGNSCNDPVKNFFEIDQRDTLKVQAYLFALAASYENYEYSGTHIKYMTSKLENVLDQKIKTALNAYSNNFCKLKSVLDAIVVGKHWTIVQELDLALCKMVSYGNSEDTAISAKCNEYTFSAKNSVFHILQLLGLIDKYPQKLTIKDALIISQRLLYNLPQIVLHKIIACDETSRSSFHGKQCTAFTNTDSSDSESNNDDDNNDDDDDNVTNDDYNSGIENIHPLDTILALVHCSDNFLCQLLLYKLSLCQIAIPMLIPDTIRGKVTSLLWALCSVERTWKSIEENHTLSLTVGVADYEGPIISFLKCGNLKESKSNLLNGTIGRENTFYYRDLQEQKTQK